MHAAAISKAPRPLTRTPSKTSRLPIAAAFTILLVGAALFFTQIYVNHNLLFDDAYITFRYARNLAEGLGLVYNPGE